MISDHFLRTEFECRCGCGFNTVDVSLIQFLEKLRSYFKQPVTINSGCRCAGYNEKIKGAAQSQHLIGRAADITVKGVQSADVADYAESIGVPGVGRYKTFTHIDSRCGSARW